MIKKLIFGFVVLVYFSSCVSNKTYSDASVMDDNSVIEVAVINTFETITSVIPEYSIIAIFNNSSDENELTNYFIEEINSILVNKSNFRIVERGRIANLEKEHNWQMDTGYVPDEQIISIVGKLGAQYVISCFITGNNNLQRLRIKTWNLESGEVLTSNVFPTNEMAVQSVESMGGPMTRPPSSDDFLTIRTIRENGITVDYRSLLTDYTDNDSNVILISERLVLIDVYIDGTPHYFVIRLYNGTDNENVHYLSEFRSTSGNNISSEHKDFFNIESDITSYLLAEGVNRQNINTISRIINLIIKDQFN